MPPIVGWVCLCPLSYCVQLKPEALEAACKGVGYTNVNFRMQEGYDHSYFFISSFVEDHVRFHAHELKK